MLVSKFEILSLRRCFNVKIIFCFSDELPVQLTLPRALREAINRPQLSSLALLGQEFWRYPMANPRPTAIKQSSSTTTISNNSPTQISSTHSKTESSGIGVTVFSAHQHKTVSSNQHTVIGTVLSPTTPMVGVHSLAGTPSDTTSSLSSFTSTGQQILSPESVDSVVLTMSPVDASQTGIVGKTSTFKVQNRKSMDLEKITVFNGNSRTTETGIVSLINSNNNHSVAHENGNNTRAVRPTPPSTLNLGPLRIPPAPPPRWTKPITPSSPTDVTPTDGQVNNFTVTTTVTFSMEGNQNSQLVEVMSPNANNSTVIFVFTFLLKRKNMRRNLLIQLIFSFKRFQNGFLLKENVRLLVIRYLLKDRRNGIANLAKIPVKTIEK